jgi:hypothetical protein
LFIAWLAAVAAGSVDLVGPGANSVIVVVAWMSAGDSAAFIFPAVYWVGRM